MAPSPLRRDSASPGLGALVLLTSLLWLGCPTARPGAPEAVEGEDTEASSPLAARLLPSRLPWKALAAARVEAYPVLLPTHPEQTVQVPEPRWRPVVIDRETIGVVFPPEDRLGFDIAWGGFQKPWQRAELTNLDPRTVGAMDAVVDGTGTVWVAFRPRTRNQPLSLVHWKPGAAAQVERVPPPVGAETSRLPYLENCPDVTLGSAPDGALDLVVRGDALQWQPLLFHGKRAPKDTAFTWNLVVNGSKTEAKPPGLQVWDFGCRNALSYDELGRRMLLSMARLTSYPFASPIRLGVAAFREGRDGRFWTAGMPVVSLPSDRDNHQRGAFDVHDHPSGFLFTGPSRFIEPKSGEPNGELPWVFMRAYSAVRDGYAFNAQERDPSAYRFGAQASEYQVQIAPGAGGKLLADGCGNFRLASVPFFNVMDDWVEKPLGPNCLYDPAPAPVFRGAPPPGLQTPTFAHGRELPFELGVCIDAENNLHVCHGGHLGTRAISPNNPLSPTLTEEPALVSGTQPAEGERDVDPSAPVTVTFDRALEQAEQSDMELWDLSTASQARGNWAPVEGAPTTLRFIPSRPLQPGHRYRLVTAARGATTSVTLPTWKLPEARRKVVNFETRGDGGVLLPDPWASPFRVACDTGDQHRDDAGCTVTVDDGAFTLLESSGTLRLHLTGTLAYDYGRTDAGTGWVEEADGGVRPDSGVIPRTNLDSLDVYPARPLNEEQELRVVVPPVFDRLGRQFEDPNIRLQLRYRPIRVADIQPAHGTTDVPVTQSLTVRVNRPQEPQQWNESYFQLTTYAPDTGLEVDYPKLDVTLELPSTYRLTPRTPLKPGMNHVLKVFSTPPVTSGFSTAP